MPYRRGVTTALEPLRPPGVAFPRNLEEGWLGDSVFLDNRGRLRSDAMRLALAVLAAVGLGPLLAWLVFARSTSTEHLVYLAVAGLWALAFAGFAWLTVAGRRAGVLLNEGQLDEARAALSWARFGQARLEGLILQRRGDHAGAAEVLLKGARSLVVESRTEMTQRMIGRGREMPEVYGGSMSPALMGELRIRAALSLTTQGELDLAHQLLTTAPTPGDYLGALHLLATAYLHLARRERIELPMVARLEQRFGALRGAWGGASLAAYGHACAGNMERCRLLLAREAECLHAPEIDRMLPLVAGWRATLR